MKNIEFVNKEKQTVLTATKWLPYDLFIKNILKKYKEVRVGVPCGLNKPFSNVYFKIEKKEFEKIITMNKAKVHFSIMKNSVVNKSLHDVLYIDKLKFKI